MWSKIGIQEIIIAKLQHDSLLNEMFPEGKVLFTMLLCDGPCKRPLFSKRPILWYEKDRETKKKYEKDTKLLSSNLNSFLFFFQHQNK